MSDGAKTFQNALVLARKKLGLLDESFSAGYPIAFSEGPADADNLLNLLKYTIELGQASLGQDHRDVSEAHHLLGVLYVALGESDKAILALTEACRIRQDNGGVPLSALAESCAALSAAFANVRDFDRAQQLIGTSIDIFRKCEGVPPQRLVTLSLWKVDWLKQLGQYDLARDVAANALGLCEHHKLGNCAELGLVHFSLGGIYAAFDQVRNSEKSFETAIEILKNHRERFGQTLWRAWFGLARAYVAMDDLDIAEGAILHGMDIYQSEVEQTPADEAQMLLQVGQFFLAKRDYEEAKKVLLSSLLTMQDLSDKPSLTMTVAVVALADALVALGQFNDAADYLSMAIGFLRRSGMTDTRNYWSIMEKVARLSFVTGDFENAETTALQCIDSSVSIADDVSKSPRILAALTKAYTCQFADSLHHFESAISGEIRRMQKVFEIGSERQRVNFANNLNPPYFMYLTLILDKFSSNLAAVRNAYRLVQKRKGLTANASRQLASAIANSKNERTHALRSELVSLRGQIARAALSVHTSNSEEAKNELVRLNTVRERFERSIGREIEEGEFNEWPADFTWQTAFDNLPKEVVVVDFVCCHRYDFSKRAPHPPDGWAEPIYVAFVVRNVPDSRIEFLDLGPAREIDALVDAFRLSLQDNVRSSARGAEFAEKDDSYREAGTLLRQRVLDPISSNIEGCKNLVVCPDAKLNFLLTSLI